MGAVRTRRRIHRAADLVRYRRVEVPRRLRKSIVRGRVAKEWWLRSHSRKMWQRR